MAIIYDFPLLGLRPETLRVAPESRGRDFGKDGFINAASGRKTPVIPRDVGSERNPGRIKYSNYI